MLTEFIEAILNSTKELVGDFIKVIPGFFAGFIAILITRSVAQKTQQLAEKIANRAVKSKSLQILFAKGAYVVTWVVGFFLACILAFPGLSLGNVVGALGLSTVAIGFAFQDIFKNFLSGILILLQEPFSIDDEIIIDNYEGFVEQIDVRTTTLRTYQGEKILIPNSTLFTNSVQVRTGFARRRTDLAVGVDYNTPLREAKSLLSKVVTNLDGVLSQPQPEIDLVNFGDSSIDFVVRYWTLPQQKIVRQIQTEAILEIKDAFDEASISIPYPIRTLYYYDQEKFNEYSPENSQ